MNMGIQRSFDDDSELAGMFEVAGAIVRETEKAVLFTDGGEAQWLPKSKIRIVRDDKRPGGAAVVFLPEWLAKNKGLI